VGVRFQSRELVPITIFRTSKSAATTERYAWLCDDEWELPTQIRALDEWLKDHGDLDPGNYVADIGFSARIGATGGGESMTLEMIEKLYRCRMEVHFSEYELAGESSGVKT
jgi:hypothetical protein